MAVEVKSDRMGLGWQQMITDHRKKAQERKQQKQQRQKLETDPVKFRWAYAYVESLIYQYKDWLHLEWFNSIQIIFFQGKALQSEARKVFAAGPHEEPESLSPAGLKTGRVEILLLLFLYVLSPLA